MASGYTTKIGASQVDLDDLFKSESSYAGSISSQYKVGSSETYTRYRARGSTTKRDDVGFTRPNGVDISNDFMDKNFVEVSLTNQIIEDVSQIIGAFPQAKYELTYQGDVFGSREVLPPNLFLIENWLGSGANASDYEVRVTKTGGGGNSNFEPGSSADGTWLSLAPSNVHVWATYPRTATGLNSIDFTIEIRMAASPNTVLTTAYITITADYDVA